MSTYAYIKNLIKDKDIASITPTSAYGVRKVCRAIDFTKDRVFVEYGPATGVFTRYILNNMTRGSKMILIEKNANFVSHLRKHFPDNRVFIYHDRAERVRDIVLRAAEEGADYVLSGIPFSFLDEATRSDIVRQTHRVLRAGGAFLPYQTFFQRDSHLLDHMKERFSVVKDGYCFLNVPPMRIYEAIK